MYIKKQLMLVTPGIDSLITLEKLSELSLMDKTVFVYFDCGTLYCEAEKYWLEQNPFRNEMDLTILDTLNFSSLNVDRMHSYIPNRNILFILSALSSFPEVDKIIVGSTKNDSTSVDNNKHYYDQLQDYLSNSMNKDIRIFSYFYDVEKCVAVKNSKLSKKYFISAYSCYDGVYDINRAYRTIYKRGAFKDMKVCGGCGLCDACLRKMHVLAYSDIMTIPTNESDRKFLICASEKVLDRVGSCGNEYPERIKSIEKYLGFLNDYANK